MNVNKRILRNCNSLNEKKKTEKKKKKKDAMIYKYTVPIKDVFDGKMTASSSLLDIARQIYIWSWASRRDRHRRKLESAANATVEGVTKDSHIGRK